MRKLTPLGLFVVMVFCSAIAAIAALAVAAVYDENESRIFTDNQSTVTIWFPEDDGRAENIGNDTTLRLATIVGSEKAVMVICPIDFEPKVSERYLANSHRFEMADGRYTSTVWTLITQKW